MNLQTSLQEFRQELTKIALVNPFLVSSLILFSLLLLFYKSKRSSSELNLPPSPPKLPVIGNLHQLGKLPHRRLKTLSEKYGPVMLLHMGHAQTLVLSTIEMVKEITKNHDLAFADRPSSTAVDLIFNGRLDMALGRQSDQQKEAKKQCVVQLLSHKKVQEFHFIREEEVAKILDKLRLSSVNREPIKVNDLYISIAHNIISRSAFGCLYENDDGLHQSFGQLGRRITKLLSAFCFNDLFPFLGWMDHLTGLIGELKMTSKELSQFFDRVIKERQALMKDDDKVDDMKCLVDVLLYLRKKGLQSDLSLDNIKGILMDMFIGGTDSLAVTMEWMMAELMKNPRIMRKAQEEIRRVVGNKPKITQADLDQMEYFKCVVKENIRYHGAALMPRQTSGGVNFQGYDIPANTRVLINAWAIQRDPNLWDRPQEFLPERFLNCSDDSENAEHRHLMFSFGFGRRACPGMSFAYAEIEYVMANLLYWFDWELPDGQKGEDLDMSEKWIFVIYKKLPLQVVPQPYSP
ncbi:cytochrome P450 71A1-like [Mercurialis annua]|uniref:cytochrome P450 71A1-like n=1 Tax=Mercurialis annua TaxID=3986 RepID=UPI0021609F57|nr:cytochrome P450 71A1-like [Mercurialis annua]